jgi:hypothetical protein
MATRLFKGNEYNGSIDLCQAGESRDGMFAEAARPNLARMDIEICENLHLFIPRHESQVIQSG